MPLNITLSDGVGEPTARKDVATTDQPKSSGLYLTDRFNAPYTVFTNMRHFNSLFLTTILMFAASAQSPFDGTWTADVVRPAPAPAQHLTITLATDKGKVTGKMAILGASESKIEWGIIKGDLITFKVKLPFGNATTTFVHLGRLEGDKLMLGRRPENLTQGVLV